MMQDLDEFEVGGPLTWADPLDDSEVTVFNVPWWHGGLNQQQPAENMGIELK